MVSRSADVKGCSFGSRGPRLSRRWRRSNLLLVASLAALQGASRPAGAQSDAWQGGDGYWDVATNWTAGLPGTTSDVTNNTSHAITYRSGDAYTVNSFLNALAGAFNLMGGTLTTTTFFKNGGAGSVAISGGAVNVTGSFLNSGTGALTFSGGTTSIGSKLQSAGVVNLTGGTLAGSGATSAFEVDNTFTINGGTLKNFTVNAGSGGQGVTITNNSNNFLSGLAMNANMDLTTNSSAIARVQNSLTLNGIANIGSSAHLDFGDSSAESLRHGNGHLHRHQRLWLRQH